MKTSIKTFVVALALVASAFTAHAEDKETKKSAGFGTAFYKTTNGKLNVFVEKVNKDASTTLLLKTATGDIVYSETVGRNEKTFGRTLNLEALSAGKYEIEVTSKGEKQSKSFELSEQKTERILAIK